MKNKIFFIFLVLLYSCQTPEETIKPVIKAVSQSVYASGVLKSKNQYQAYSTVSGIIEEIYVTEGDSVKVGQPILRVSNEVQQLNLENARLNADFNNLSANQGKLNDAEASIDFLSNKLKNDSLLFFRQKKLWEQSVGTKVELEQRELSFQNSKNAYHSALIRYNDLKRQLNFASSQAQKNLNISQSLAQDFILKSQMDGLVYNLTKSKGELVNPQSPLATIGASNQFILEMQVDEYDILVVKPGLKVIVKLDSYKDQVFEARLTRINPLMDERSKTFLVEAEFIEKPAKIYPNVSFEASILIESKERALLIPRNYLLNDSSVVMSNGDTVKVKTGLKDYQMVEIISGISIDDEIKKPL
ncbi:efflux RND transporter periplasmic adaptor subunit [Daejeonella sp.]|uniref:efflux RND transporter periplasmic adaptor subunit n=1 Tax=Daejeonella sp. TaxID=2805397 RepID=UPI0025B9587C|nr:efflux RND transporter periplasmic adaptor subunit [Daejeonella sp.]